MISVALDTELVSKAVVLVLSHEEVLNIDEG